MYQNSHGEGLIIYLTSDYLKPLTSGTSCNRSDVGGVLGLKVSIMMVPIFFFKDLSVTLPWAYKAVACETTRSLLHPSTMSTMGRDSGGWDERSEEDMLGPGALESITGTSGSRWTSVDQ